MHRIVTLGVLSFTFACAASTRSGRMSIMTTSVHGGATRGPDPTQLKNYLTKGLTQAQIVEAWEKKTGVRISRSTVGMAIARFGMDSSHPRPRYEDMLPWKVSVPHRMKWDARMLRLEAKRRRGKALTERELRLLTQWRQQLEEAQAVIVYEHDTDEGFFWVNRKAEDDDIIRRPKG